MEYKIKTASELGLSGTNKYIYRPCLECGKFDWVRIRKGKPRAIICSSCNVTGERNPHWKGQLVGYWALHNWIKDRKPKPSFCEVCQEAPPYDLASKDDSYTRNPNDWQWLCRRCHMILDGRLSALISRNKHRTIP